MLGHPRSVGTIAVTALAVCLALPVRAQQGGRGWILNAGGGYATQLDPGSAGLGSFSVGASALRASSNKLSLGVEGGYDRHEAFETRGELWWNGTNGTTIECPAPCTFQRVTMANRYVGSAWHLGGVLRYTFAPERAVVPSAELGLGLYGIRNYRRQRTRDAATGAPVPQLSAEGVSTDLAPGVSGALGVDVFPGNGRIGVGAVLRLRAAGRPANDYFLGIGFAALQVRFTVR